MKLISKRIYISYIKEIFELAVDDEVIMSNPALNIKLKPDKREEIQYYSKEVNKLCKNANITRRKLYCTRHTFATFMLKENIVSINELAGLLGHSSPQATPRHYSSIIEPKISIYVLIFLCTVTTKNKKVD